MSRKTVVITGAARGLGKAGAKKFLESEKWNVVLCDINEELLSKSAKELGDKFGSEYLLSFTVDITSQSSIESMIQKTLAKFKKIDCLINNAGITKDSMIYKMNEENWDQVINVNLKGTFNCAKAVIPHMIENKYGTIINTSSVVGVYGNIGQSNYAASKFGVIGLTKTWAKELGKKGIRVNAVAPGFTLTEMVGTVPEEILKGIADKTPLKRLGAPEDIANAYYFLASDEASFITGHVLSVDGGLVL